jgi:hypothetical protein
MSIAYEKSMKGNQNPHWGKIVTEETRKKIGNANRGPDTKMNGQYIMRFAPGHVKADRQGFVLEHRLVMEEKIGRPIFRTEVIHHIDTNPMNNIPENLAIFSSSGSHANYHRRLNQYINS